MAGRSAEAFSGSGLNLVIPTVPKRHTSAWAHYSIVARDSGERKHFQDLFGAARIPTAIYYHKPLHLQQAFAKLGYAEGDRQVWE